jgi:hypothetical protein
MIFYALLSHGKIREVGAINLLGVPTMLGGMSVVAAGIRVNLFCLFPHFSPALRRASPKAWVPGACLLTFSKTQFGKIGGGMII